MQDDWDASEDEAPKATGPAAPAGPIRKKGITKQKIAEREAAEKAEAEARAAQEAADADPAERRRREQAAVLAADMDNLSGLLGSAVVNGGSDALFESNAQSKDELAALAERLAERIHTSYGSRPLYAELVESLVKQLCMPLKDLQVRKASSALSTLANEMQAAQRATAKGGKKKAAAKPTLSAPRGGVAYVACFHASG